MCTDHILGPSHYLVKFADFIHLQDFECEENLIFKNCEASIPQRGIGIW
jgi:hypothetical protein